MTKGADTSQTCLLVGFLSVNWPLFCTLYNTCMCMYIMLVVVPCLTRLAHACAHMSMLHASHMHVRTVLPSQKSTVPTSEFLKEIYFSIYIIHETPCTSRMLWIPKKFLSSISALCNSLIQSSKTNMRAWPVILNLASILISLDHWPIPAQLSADSNIPIHCVYV